MTNGMPIVVRGTMKPISTLLRGLPSVDLNSRQPEHSAYERSDVCALSAASDHDLVDGTVLGVVVIITGNDVRRQRRPGICAGVVSLDSGTLIENNDPAQLGKPSYAAGNLKTRAKVRASSPASGIEVMYVEILPIETSKIVSSS